MLVSDNTCDGLVFSVQNVAPSYMKTANINITLEEQSHWLICLFGVCKLSTYDRDNTNGRLTYLMVDTGVGS